MKDKWVHPELREGEVFVGNVMGYQRDSIGWKSKRFGRVAYDVNGDCVAHAKRYNFRPMFVQEKEWTEQMGMTIDEWVKQITVKR